MREGVSSGIHFALTSGVITTLGLIVGLHSGTHSALAVIGGIVTIAIADALGIHIAKEAENRHSHAHVWSATLATFAAKFAMASTFVVPVVLLPLDLAVLVSATWGMLVIAVLSLVMTRAQGARPLPVCSSTWASHCWSSW